MNCFWIYLERAADAATIIGVIFAIYVFFKWKYVYKKQKIHDKTLQIVVSLKMLLEKLDEARKIGFKPDDYFYFTAPVIIFGGLKQLILNTTATPTGVNFDEFHKLSEKFDLFPSFSTKEHVDSIIEKLNEKLTTIGIYKSGYYHMPPKYLDDLHQQAFDAMKHYDSQYGKMKVDACVEISNVANKLFIDIEVVIEEVLAFFNKAKHKLAATEALQASFKKLKIRFFNFYMACNTCNQIYQNNEKMYLISLLSSSFLTNSLNNLLDANRLFIGIKNDEFSKEISALMVDLVNNLKHVGDL
jgi:hypothetical protein